jgi:hypothetical protein
MIDINREELAWAAGFFDGEGYIGIRKPPGQHANVIPITRAKHKPDEPYYPYSVNDYLPASRLPASRKGTDTCHDNIPAIYCQSWNWRGWQ